MEFTIDQFFCPTDIYMSFKLNVLKCYVIYFVDFMNLYLKSDRMVGRKRERWWVTCSKGPKVRMKPWAAVESLYIGHITYQVSYQGIKILK